MSTLFEQAAALVREQAEAVREGRYDEWVSGMREQYDLFDATSHGAEIRAARDAGVPIYGPLP